MRTSHLGPVRQLKALIKGGNVSVDGVVTRAPKEKVAEEALLAIDGVAIHRDGLQTTDFEGF